MRSRLCRDFAGGAVFCVYDQLGILEALCLCSIFLRLPQSFLISAEHEFFGAQFVPGPKYARGNRKLLCSKQ